MKKQYKLGVIGGGFMATAILKGVVYSDRLRAKKIIVADPSAKARENLSELGVYTTANNRDVAGNCDYLLFAVKPQNFPAVAESLRGIPVEKAITIMAGVKKRVIKDALFKEPKVVRVMPNLPCSIGFGMTALDLSDFEEDVDDCAFVQEIFNRIGNVLVVPEEKLNAVTGISGSGPAYVYLFIDGLIRAGVKQGLTEDEAKSLAVQTVLGGADMVAHSDDKTLDELIGAVCSKGGTTIQAVESFRRDDMEGMIDRAVSACVSSPFFWVSWDRQREGSTPPSPRAPPGQADRHLPQSVQPGDGSEGGSSNTASVRMVPRNT